MEKGKTEYGNRYDRQTLLDHLPVAYSSAQWVVIFEKAYDSPSWPASEESRTFELSSGQH
jgi:hypothetical protein